jgi:hypothetical protein
MVQFFRTAKSARAINLEKSVERLVKFFGSVNGRLGHGSRRHFASHDARPDVFNVIFKKIHSRSEFGDQRLEVSKKPLL